jgi:hypothetical protein
VNNRQLPAGFAGIVAIINLHRAALRLWYWSPVGSLRQGVTNSER